MVEKLLVRLWVWLWGGSKHGGEWWEDDGWV